MKKSVNELGAVINIGSNDVTLKICENQNGTLKDIEFLEYPLYIAHETFINKKISFDKVDILCKVIKDYYKIINQYRIKNIKVFATTALREAENKAYIIDQIKIKTGIEVDILDDSIEKTIIYKEMLKKISHLMKSFKGNLLLAFIGTGSLGIAVYKDDYIDFFQNIRTGSFKLSEILGDMQEYTNRFYLVLKEYLNTFTNTLYNNLKDRNITNFIVSGREIELIAYLCNVKDDNDLFKIPTEKFNQLYEEIKKKNAYQLYSTYNISQEQAEILLPAMTIYKTFIDLANAKNIIAPKTNISNYILADMLISEEKEIFDQKFKNSAIISAREIGKRFQYDKKHAETVEYFSLKIFDKIKRIHGLGERERLLLQIASILHDSGKFVNIKKHYLRSYNLIRNSDIIGLTDRELEISANIAMYHSQVLPEKDDNYMKLSEKDKVLVSKLVAIIRLADALDRSHTQKFKEVEIDIVKNKLKLVGLAFSDTTLEQWTFKTKAEFFKEVYGIDAELNVKRV